MKRLLMLALLLAAPCMGQALPDTAGGCDTILDITRLEVQMDSLEVRIDSLEAMLRRLRVVVIQDSVKVKNVVGPVLVQPFYTEPPDSTWRHFTRYEISYEGEK